MMARRGRPRFLASTANLAEALQAAQGGADIVDLKDPSLGALGAWGEPALREAVRLLGGKVTLSATTGDLAMQPALIADAVRRVARTGVDYVKVGFFDDGEPAACVAALAAAAALGTRLVAVLFADQHVDLAILARLAASGFKGVLLDTADKHAGGLRRHLDDARIDALLRRARMLGLQTGLAGSLTVHDVAALARLRPDVLGFRGALCFQGDRKAGLDPVRLNAVRQALDDASSATATAGKQAATAF